MCPRAAEGSTFSAYPNTQQNQNPETPVGLVVIRCPQTGRAIPTGIEADRRAFAQAPVFFSRTFCPLCRTHHEWFAKEAWVREEPRSMARFRRRADRLGEVPDAPRLASHPD
jgi:hypothetical protein